MNKLLLSTCMALAVMGSCLAQGKKTDAGSLGNRTFVYGQDVRLAHPIVIDPADKRPLCDILDQALDGTGITYRITKNHILLFAPEPEEITLDRKLDEVTVETLRPDISPSRSLAGTVTIPVNQIMQTPSLMGEADVLKTLQLLPGVQTGLSGQVSMSVRGGNIDQNLYLLDGVLLYNVEHVLGFESAFMPDAVKHVNFYSGAFPSRYGGRLSSVVDVRTREGDMRHYHGTFSIGALSSHLSVEGPLWRDRTSFIVSARRSYADWMINAFYSIFNSDIEDMHLGLYFYDLNAKVNHRFSDRDRLFLSFYKGRDALGSSQETGARQEYALGMVPGITTSENKGSNTQDISSGNTLYHARWNHIFSPRLFSNLTLGYNQFRQRNEFSERARYWVNDQLMSDNYYKSSYRSGIDDLTASLDFDYTPHPHHHIKMGAQYTMHEFRPEMSQTVVRNFDEQQQEMTQQDLHKDAPSTFGHETALYFEDDLRLPHRWQVNAGLRLATFTTDGKTYPAIEPRISVSKQLDKGWRVKADYTLMHQYVHKLSTSPIAKPGDLWVSVTGNVKPMEAHQWAVGVSNDQLFSGWNFGMEAYWKEMNHVLEFHDGSMFTGNTRDWQQHVSEGRGRAYGLEFFVARTKGRTTGQFSYTLSKSDRWFPDGSINNGRHFPYRLDRRHVMHLSVQHQLTPHVDLNAVWSFASGAMATVAKQQTRYYVHVDTEGMPATIGTPLQFGKQDRDYYSSRNNYRLEPTHQLDLSVNIHHDTRRGERIWSFGLMNAYCHLNQDLLYTDVKNDTKQVGSNPDGSPIYEVSSRNVLKKVTLFPILPYVTYTYKF